MRSTPIASGRLALILSMILLFVIALVAPFPREGGSGRHQP